MTVTVKMLVDKLKLKVIYGNEKLLSKPITTADISRPGLEMTGYFDFYSPERIPLPPYGYIPKPRVRDLMVRQPQDPLESLNSPDLKTHRCLRPYNFYRMEYNTACFLPDSGILLSQTLNRQPSSVWRCSTYNLPYTLFRLHIPAYNGLHCHRRK